MAKYKRKVIYKRKKVYKKKSLSRQLLRLADMKEKTAQSGETSMFHNSIYSISPTQTITQGTTNQTRVGDSVYLQSFHLNGFFAASSAANAVQKYRVIVGWTGRENANTAFATGVIAATDLYLPNTFGDQTIGIINSKAFTVLSDMIIDINSNVSTSKDLKSFSINIPLRQNFRYISEGGAFGKNKNLIFVVVPYINGGTPGATNAGTISFSWALKFKDP